MTIQKTPKDGSTRPPRTNMFVMATIYVEGLASPVKIRNLSPTGALIEGHRIPREETKLTLRRGELQIDGKVAWYGNGRAGMRFFSAISVKEWLPGGESRRKQDLVNALFHGSVAEGATPRNAAKLPKKYFSSAEIIDAHDMLQALSDALADDPQAVRRHGGKLQSLDFAIQILSRLGEGPE